MLLSIKKESEKHTIFIAENWLTQKFMQSTPLYSTVLASAVISTDAVNNSILKSLTVTSTVLLSFLSVSSTYKVNKQTKAQIPATPDLNYTQFIFFSCGVPVEYSVCSDYSIDYPHRVRPLDHPNRAPLEQRRIFEDVLLIQFLSQQSWQADTVSIAAICNRLGVQDKTIIGWYSPPPPPFWASSTPNPYRKPRSYFLRTITDEWVSALK